MNHFTARDGARIAYRDEGEGAPLLFLHGLNAHGGLFQPQADALGSAFRVIRPDFRGHGATLAQGAPDIPMLAADMADMLDHLGLDRVIGIGWSLGAMVLWKMGQDRFAGHVTIDMTPKVRNDADWQLGLIDLGMGTPPADETPNQRGRRIAEVIVAENAGDRGALVDWMGPLLGEADLGAVASLGASLAERDYRAVLPGITVPTLVTHGGASRFYRAETSAFVASAVRDGRLERFDRSGHAPHLEEPERFNQVLREFVSGCA